MIAVFKEIEAWRKEGSRGSIDLGVWNASARPSFKGFLDTTSSDFVDGINTSLLSPTHFARSLLPIFLAAPPSKSKSSGVLLLTGATASIRGGPSTAPFSAAKFSLRALGQSLGREFQPKGVHVAHIIVDGRIDEDTEGGTVSGPAQDRISTK